MYQIAYRAHKCLFSRGLKKQKGSRWLPFSKTDAPLYLDKEVRVASNLIDIHRHTAFLDAINQLFTLDAH